MGHRSVIPYGNVMRGKCLNGVVTCLSAEWEMKKVVFNSFRCSAAVTRRISTDSCCYYLCNKVWSPQTWQSLTWSLLYLQSGISVFSLPSSCAETLPQQQLLSRFPLPTFLIVYPPPPPPPQPPFQSSHTTFALRFLKITSVQQIHWQWSFTTK